MHWIYLSPHLDDVVFSCGGLIWQQARSGERIEIWTLCAGDPPDAPFSGFAQELHARWDTPHDSVARRRAEDRRACRLLGAAPRYFPIPDCIYRRPGLDYWSPAPHSPLADIVMYPDRDALFGPLHPLEAHLPAQAVAHLAGLVPAGACLVSPLTLGGHVDHRLARQAAERITPRPCYYADYPYAADHLDEVEAQLPPGYRKFASPLPPAALDAWIEAMLAYASQISTFWQSAGHLRANLEDYLLRLGGAASWQPA